jgi:hypothetical protein
VFTWTSVLSLLGPSSISIMLVIMGLLSRKLGRVTSAAPHYIGFFIAAVLVGIGAVARFVALIAGTGAPSDDNILWLTLHSGIPTIGVTLGAIVAWRYWSWLLAERD